VRMTGMSACPAKPELEAPRPLVQSERGARFLELPALSLARLHMALPARSASKHQVGEAQRTPERSTLASKRFLDAPRAKKGPERRLGVKPDSVAEQGGSSMTACPGQPVGERSFEAIKRRETSKRVASRRDD
jgi:hypothetical protein